MTMANDTGALTNMWMTNPWMFDPTQKSNPYSNFNAGRIPFPPTYNGVPTNAATGQPIQSFLDWQQANPGGTTINNTPAQPQQPQQQDVMALRNAALTGQPGAAMAYGANFAPQGSPPGIQQMYGQNFAAFVPQGNWRNAAPAAAPQPAPQAPPNNWQAALNALARPPTPVTPGATAPLQQGYQPSGGVNQAFLQQAQGQPGMNQRFLSALAAIQGRPQ
jgi:hypothetical protein